MLSGDDQPRFGQQEMHVGDAPVQRIFDRNHRAIGAKIAHRIDRIGKIKARQRQPIRERLARGDMRIRAGGTLKSDGAGGIDGGGSGHLGDERAGGFGEIFHGCRAVLRSSSRCKPSPPRPPTALAMHAARIYGLGDFVALTGAVPRQKV